MKQTDFFTALAFSDQIAPSSWEKWHFSVAEHVYCCSFTKSAFQAFSKRYRTCCQANMSLRRYINYLCFSRFTCFAAVLCTLQKPGYKFVTLSVLIQAASISHRCVFVRPACKAWTSLHVGRCSSSFMCSLRALVRGRSMNTTVIFVFLMRLLDPTLFVWHLSIDCIFCNVWR